MNAATPTTPSSLFTCVSRIASATVPNRFTPNRIDIALFTQKFTNFPTDLLQFTQEQNIPLPQIDTLRGQALALLSHEVIRGQKYITRNDAIQFYEVIGMASQDAIQPFNKTFGLKRLKLSRGLYCLEYPFVSEKVHLEKRIGLGIDRTNRDAQIEETKQWWRQNCIDVPNEEWHVGHLDPTVGDASENNLVYQPPIQAKFRDRFKFDKKFLKMWPTAKELVGNVDKYYTQEEQQAILETLLAKKLNPDKE